MKSKYGEIERCDIEWLYSAISDYDKQVIYIFDNSAISTDGVRMHIINPDNLPESMSQLPESTKDILNKSVNLESCLSSFRVNPKYLQEALSVFGGQVKIELLGDKEGFHGIKISSGSSNKVAFISCMKADDNE